MFFFGKDLENCHLGPWTLPFGMIFFAEQNPRFKETHEPPMLGGALDGALDGSFVLRFDR